MVETKLGGRCFFICYITCYNVLKSTIGRVNGGKIVKNSNVGRKTIGNFLLDLKIEFWCGEKENEHGNLKRQN